ncbi:nuclear protein localization protein 4 homolog [Styela clava]
MIIRIQSKDGTKRVEVTSSETVTSFLGKVAEEFALANENWCLFQNRDRTNELKKGSRSKLSNKKLKHGDMCYLIFTDGMNVAGDGGVVENEAPPIVKFTEDEIDVELWKQDGRIPQNEKSSVRGGMFKIDDLPINSWDESYLKSKDIKFLSFHAYMRQQTSGVDKGKYFKLESTRTACKLEGISEEKRSLLDLPTAITLNQQKFRHVDNIMFENREVADRFLNYWRNSGNQRMGFMYGRYTQHKEVPLGIRAEVCAIYEPPQESSANSLKILPDPHQEIVEKVAKALGLQKVGWIISDLVAEDRSKGTVKHFRDAETHFLTAEECITAAAFQNQHRNPCRLAKDGTYGSKFATVVVSGDKEHHISFEGYQVSNQCMDLVRDGCLIPTLDAPELGYIRESSQELYVPDVYYKMKDEYGNEITKLARPLPLAYLLLNVPAAFAIETQYTCSKPGNGFAIENREALGELQNMEALASYFDNSSPDEFVQTLSDFHFLVFLAKMDQMQSTMDQLLEAVKERSSEKALEWSHNPAWMSLQQEMHHQAAQPSGMDMDPELREAIQRSLREK